MLLRLPHGFLRRHLSTLERVAVAAVFGFLLYQLMAALPVYPGPWQIVVAVTVFAVMLWSPPVAYYLAVIAALAPLYAISMYVAVLFLAVAMLGQRVFIHHLGATLLALSAPWLAQFHLEWLPVLLGGLWWGKAGGAWIGGLAALWGQTLFGMTGTNPDWIAMMGTAPATGEIALRFGPAGSLETLHLLVLPLAPNPDLLLYHLLQIVLWAMVGGLVGGLVDHEWAQHSQPWRAIAIGLGGAAVLLAGQLGFAMWLEQFPSGDFAWIVPGLFETALYSGLLAVLLEAARDFVERPLAAGWRRSAARAEQRGAQKGILDQVRALRQRQPAPAQSSASGWASPGAASPSASPDGRSMSQAPDLEISAAEGEAGQPPYPPLRVPENLPRRDAKKQRPDDIIKIELD